ncbi:LysM peptidoglycan-binding domain-containing protein [Marinibactrum halimedae]|uniref:LysM domain-containing protein n=1 Tax=Marinibactrum halimedae TaxID=1444977 RepID=A0AA37T1P1_9GAMM|nr:LysM peptidoglycan-binding domain-containing protein [Marinibactrum halimedae]MCD9460904.1 LysM peptidoglycan-binding domain-containing protein [Marinibactrum halimedae]GLS24578.1 hypothetical protein GCM10007877_02920 [Marinibactrum halimedae]
MKKIILGVLLAASAVAAWAEDVMLRDDHPDQYTVVKGDTLWDISDTFLKNPWMWPEIWHANPQIENPHLIFPGDIISLIYLDGKPRLTVDRRTVRLQPGTVKMAPAVRVVPLDEAIPAIPLDAIDEFLNKNRVVSREEMELAPYVVAGHEQRIVLGAGDRLYARGTFDENIPVYGIYRLGQAYTDPFTKEVLGYEAAEIGAVKVKEIDRDIATMNAIRTTEEIRLTDRLLPDEERSIDSTFYPSPPSDEYIEGVIMSVSGGLTQVGKLDVVALNLGDRDGLKVGNVLSIYKEGLVIKDRVAGDKVKLPEEQAGLLMVFRTFEKMSYGLVLESERPLKVGDKLYSPSRRVVRKVAED